MFKRAVLRVAPAYWYFKASTRKKSIYLALMIAPALTFAAGTAPESVNVTAEPELVRNVLELLNQSRHDSVLAICDRLIARQPESPIGYFLAADAYETMMRDFRVRSYQTQFDSLITIAAARASDRLLREPTAAVHFYTGAIKGYYCLALFQTGSYIKALKTAESSVSLLRKASLMEPDFADPLFGIAVFDYNKSKFLFGLLGGSQQEAISKLKKVIEKGRFLSTNASYTLQAIYYENDQYDSALVINDRLFRHYPDNPSCLYTRAMLLEKLDRPAEALEIWNTLIGKISALRPASNGYLAECHYHVAAIHHRTGSRETAKKLLIQAAQFAAHRHDAEELDGSYVKFSDIKNRINTALREWNQ
jgi:tetratricopeptide (TPR) repeat protein